ncbi:MAG TPA: ACT domain-containing protein, partial [Acidobacteriota bacterium]|nr:ACT domain-containing protein [Acidobacteriota bacterium]
MSKKTTAVLLISCPDQRGLVARIAQFIYQNNGNILHSDHHTDAESGLFLMRIEWDLEGFRIPREKIAEVFAPQAAALHLQWELHFSDPPPRMA